MNEHERIAAADAAKRALDDHLRPAFALVEQVYTERVTQLAASEPWAVDKIRALSLALKVSQEVRAHLEGIVADGPLAEATVKHLAKIARMSPERRRILGL